MKEMILFYSEYCNHSKMLLESIKRHDKDKQVKMVCIEAVRSKGMKIDPKIHSVPAMFFPKTNDVLFGKEVFDFLFLPGRGKLVTVSPQTLSTNPSMSSMSSTSSTSNNTSDFPNVPQSSVNEPIAYVSSIIGQDFESLDTNDTKDDISFKWERLDGGGIVNGSMDNIVDTRIMPEDSSKKNLPSMEEIMQMRNIDDVWKT